MCVNKSNISLSEVGRKHVSRGFGGTTCDTSREYTKPVRFFASVDARKWLKPASTEDGYKQFCSVDRP